MGAKMHNGGCYFGGSGFALTQTFEGNVHGVFCGSRSIGDANGWECEPWFYMDWANGLCHFNAGVLPTVFLYTANANSMI
jgi:hypothetical protein